MAAFALAGVTWVSSSGVIAKLLRDLGRLSNRETPAILAVLVIEDLAMAFYLPILSAIVIGVSLMQGAISVAIAVGVVALILYVALRHGHVVSRLFPADQYEPLLLGVLGLTMLVAGLAAEVSVSAAVGAFLVGIALSGRVAENASTVLTPLRDLFAAIFFVFFGLTTDSSALVPMLLPALALAIVTIITKLVTGRVRGPACRRRHARPVARRPLARPARRVLDRHRRYRGRRGRRARDRTARHCLRAHHDHRGHVPRTPSRRRVVPREVCAGAPARGPPLAPPEPLGSAWARSRAVAGRSVVRVLRGGRGIRSIGGGDRIDLCIGRVGRSRAVRERGAPPGSRSARCSASSPRAAACRCEYFMSKRVAPRVRIAPAIFCATVSGEPT